LNNTPSKYRTNR